jgi:hypothetical protein
MGGQIADLADSTDCADTPLPGLTARYMKIAKWDFLALKRKKEAFKSLLFSFIL